jgi:hypothetical protein
MTGTEDRRAGGGGRSARRSSRDSRGSFRAIFHPARLGARARCRPETTARLKRAGGAPRRARTRRTQPSVTRVHGGKKEPRRSRVRRVTGKSPRRASVSAPDARSRVEDAAAHVIPDGCFRRAARDSHAALAGCEKGGKATHERPLARAGSAREHAPSAPMLDVRGARERARDVCACVPSSRTRRRELLRAPAWRAL